MSGRRRILPNRPLELRQSRQKESFLPSAVQNAVGLVGQQLGLALVLLVGSKSFALAVEYLLDRPFL